MLIEGKAFRLGILLLSVAVCIAAAFLKGPSLDEFWTLIYAAPTVPLPTAWGWWSADTGHPPAYYALIRLAMEILPYSVTSARLINLIPWAVFGWYCLFARSNAGIRRFCVILFIALSGSYYSIERLAEARAFFIPYVLLSFLIVEIRALEDGPAKRRLVRIVLLAALVPLFDYPVFCGSIALLAMAAMALSASGRMREAAWIGAAIAVGVAVALACLANAMGYERVSPPYLVSMLDYGKNAVTIIAAGLLGNLAVAAAAGLAVLGTVTDGSAVNKSRPGLRAYDSRLVLPGAMVLALAGYGLLNLVLQALINRQLIALVPLTCGALAAWFPSRVDRRYMAALIVGAMVLSQAYVLHRLSKTPNFDRHAPLLASAQERCSGFRVLAIDPEELGETSPTLARRLRKSAVRLAHGEIAKRFGIALAPSAARSFDARCGGAVWILHAWIGPGDTAGSLLDKLGIPVDGRQRTRARVHYQDNSVVILVAG